MLLPPAIWRILVFSRSRLQPVFGVCIIGQRRLRSMNSQANQSDPHRTHSTMIEWKPCGKATPIPGDAMRINQSLYATQKKYTVISVRMSGRRKKLKSRRPSLCRTAGRTLENRRFSLAYSSLILLRPKLQGYCAMAWRTGGKNPR